MKRLIFIFVLLASFTASAQLTNRYAFPGLAGLRFREANVTNGTNDSGNSALYGVPANYYDQDYYWDNAAGPSGDEWHHWIVPQVLAAKAAGANCIRLMWSADAFIGDSSHHGAATWLGTNTWSGLTNEIGMMASLCASNGMWFYPACSESRVINDGNLPTNMVYTYISNFCAYASLYDNIPAIDVVQEADGATGSTNSFVAQDCYLWIKAAHDGLKRPIPLTCSLNGAGAATDLNLNNRWQCYNLVSAGVDYFDCHAYYQYALADWYQAVTNKWNLPVVFGETGINMSGVWGSGPDNEVTHPYSSEKVTDFFFAAQAVAQQPYFQLTGVWAIAPNWLTNEEDFGLYGGAQDGSYALTNSRERLRNFAMFPTNIQPPNYSWSVISTGANTTASSYSGYTRYAIQSGMLEADGSPIWQRTSNMLQPLGNTSAITYADGTELLYQSSLPNSLGEHVQVDIPPQSPPLYISEYCTWEIIVRGQSGGDFYLAQLTHDTGGTYDNKIEVFKHVSGTNTSLGTVTYAPSHPLDLTKWWRFSVDVSTNVSPTTILCTVSNVTDGIVMSTPLSISDSSATLQNPGGMGLCGYLGQPYYTNIQFAATFDNSPTSANAPSGSATGNSVLVSWSAATGGSGTINYTPQYVSQDSSGFPVSTVWTNGTQTTSTSQTLSSLPANTSLLIRVMTTDSTSATNYSSWQSVTTGSAALGGQRKQIYIPFGRFGI